jgi:uncharacterized protein (DUF2235 family)
MAKNVVVCCDGIANEFSVDRTNVVKLFFTLVRDPTRQATFYHPGIGTMEPPGALTPFRRRVSRVSVKRLAGDSKTISETSTFSDGLFSGRGHAIHVWV